jgi:hypothetical protein
MAVSLCPECKQPGLRLQSFGAASTVFACTDNACSVQNYVGPEVLNRESVSTDAGRDDEGQPEDE